MEVTTETIAGTFGWSLHPSLAVRMDGFNTEATDNERAMHGQEYNHDGTLVQVDTPWAMGFIDRQGVSLV